MNNQSLESSFKSIAESSARNLFIKKVYLNLALALLAFVGLEYLLLQIPQMVDLSLKMISGYNWLIVLGLFMFVSWIANSWAINSTSLSTQYMGLFLYVAAQSVIFTPLIILANLYAPGTIAQAGILTIALFLGITFIALFTGKDFSFLGSILAICSIIALGVIVCSLIFGFQLGLLFSAAMIIFAAFAILYQTSAIVHQYNTNQYVAAALGLFASVTLMFWYILSFLMGSRR